jgi:4-carboxymuconolactone decarboxylase
VTDSTVTDSTDRAAYLSELAARRGYVLPPPRALVESDFELMQAMNGLVEKAYLAPRCLSGREKELIFIVSLTVLRADHGHIEGHIEKALNLGVDSQDILEAIEIALPEAGVVAFQHGVEAWLAAVERHADGRA